MYLSNFGIICCALAVRQPSWGPRGQPPSVLCSMDRRLTKDHFALRPQKRGCLLGTGTWWGGGGGRGITGGRTKE